MAVKSKLGPPPVWVPEKDATTIKRWHELGVEMRLEADSRPVAEMWLAAWYSVREAHAENKLSGAETVPTSRLIEQLRMATQNLQQERSR